MRRTLCAFLFGTLLIGGLVPAAAAQEVPAQPAQPAEPAEPADPGVPADSGAGRRIVYSNGQQRVWLVEEDGSLAKTHLVSGRRNFPRPGNYAVFSKSPTTRSGSLHLRYMVRWHQTRRLAVGFHSIPTSRGGRPIQSESQLGTFRSRGCVRQRVEDAAFLWDWAPLGTRVVVIR